MSGTAGYMLAARDVFAIGLHDCDIVTYDRSLLACPMYPVVNPVFPYVFAKDITRALTAKGGRVTRLLITPPLAALRKVCGDNSYLRFLDSFRHPLAGEFAMRSHVVGDIRIPSDWGLEIGVLWKCAAIIQIGLSHKSILPIIMTTSIKSSRPMMPAAVCRA